MTDHATDRTARPTPGTARPTPGTARPATGAEPGRPRVHLAVEYAREQYSPVGDPDARDDHEVNVIVEVRTEGLEAVVPRRPPQRSEVVIIDCSGSMAHPTLRKIAAARKAAAAAIERLPDGTHFALVAGTDTARLAYPARDRLADPTEPATVAATPATVADGSRTARTLEAHGGTRISAWLTLAHRLLTARPDAPFRHALLLTDGRDEHGRAEELERVLDVCAGEFTCDALGIGEDWDAAQLQRIADRLHGRAEAVVADGAEEFEAQLTGLFHELVGASTRRALPQLTLDVRTAPYLSVDLFRQVHPTVLDLTDTAVDEGDRTLFPTGAWGDEDRWYELRMRVDPDHPDHPGRREPHAARLATVRLEAEGAEDVELPGEEHVTVRWTGEEAPPTDLGTAGRHFRRQDELREASRAGAMALYHGETAEAERELGRAVRLAYELRDEARLERLRDLVTVEKAALGQVRIRDDITPGRVQALIVRSSHTAAPPSAHGRGGAPPSPSGGEPVRCARCSARVRPGRFCENCGHPLDRSLDRSLDVSRGHRPGTSRTGER
ncbi:vWA domain-containing protein [Streptomyces macrosporus]|uniref:VWA domain-containing protein n=1 Tax=Streptomyces macrosporus TaxID=44032 RepID=A0ABN3KAH4_9ACTN